MKRNKIITVPMTLTTLALGVLCIGCMSRIFSEGMGSSTGASGRVSDGSKSQELSKYRSLHIETITVGKSVQPPAEMAALIRTDFMAVADKRGLGGKENPGLTLTGEIVHYETGGKVDTVTGPFEEVILLARLTDVQSGSVVRETNLVGRSKASSSSGSKNLSEGVGKALNKWLKNGGLKKDGEKDED